MGGRDGGDVLVIEDGCRVGERAWEELVRGGYCANRLAR